MMRVVRAVAAGDATILTQPASSVGWYIPPLKECEAFMAKVPTPQDFERECGQVLEQASGDGGSLSEKNLRKFEKSLSHMRRILYTTQPPHPLPAGGEQRAPQAKDWNLTVNAQYERMVAAHAKRYELTQDAPVNLSDEEWASYRFCRMASLLSGVDHHFKGDDVINSEQWRQFVRDRQKHGGLVPQDWARSKAHTKNTYPVVEYNEATEDLDDFIKALPKPPAQ